MREVYIGCDDESPLLDGPWLVQPHVETTHVIFELECTRHELDRGCWCGPELEFTDPITEIPHARPLVIHRQVSLPQTRSSGKDTCQE